MKIRDLVRQKEFAHTKNKTKKMQEKGSTKNSDYAQDVMMLLFCKVNGKGLFFLLTQTCSLVFLPNTIQYIIMINITHVGK